MKYAWGVRGGGKGQGGNQRLLFPHLGSFIIITVVNDSIQFTLEIEVRRKQRGEAGRRK